MFKGLLCYTFIDLLLIVICTRMHVLPAQKRLHVQMYLSTQLYLNVQNVFTCSNDLIVRCLFCALKRIL